MWGEGGIKQTYADEAHETHEPVVLITESTRIVDNGLREVHP